MYGTMERKQDSLPLLGSNQERRIRFSTTKRNHQRPVLETIVSRGRLTESTANQRRPKSFLYSMLNPRSTEWQAVAFKWFIAIVISIDLVAFIMSTDSDFDQDYAEIFISLEGIDSSIFLIDYILRLIVVTESAKYGNMGPIKGRLRYMMTPPALIDFAATFPYFLEHLSGHNLPTLTYLRSFRLLRILKTERFSETTRSVYRVFRYNSEILLVGVWIGMSFVLITAVLMYYLRPRGEEHSQFNSLRATLFLATMMLTGQGGPDGELPWYTSAVVVLTGIISIGMFAIPASMLTWGFEGEAERLAKLRWKRAHEVSQSEADNNDEWSYSSDDRSADEEYLNTIAGLGDDSDDEEEKVKKAFDLADMDGSGHISRQEFFDFARSLTSKTKETDEFLGDSRLRVIEKKVEENCKKLDRICEMLEAMKNTQQ